MENAKAILQIIQEDPVANVDDRITVYQLRPTLLDTIIPDAIALLNSQYVNSDNTHPLHTIYTFARVRGYKTVLQNFSTDVNLLLTLRCRFQALPIDDWQSQYSLLLWLAAVVLVPFDLESIESGLTLSLYKIASEQLSKSGIQRDAASVLMARLLTRSGNSQSADVDDFLSIHTLKPNDTKSIGLLQVLAQVLDRVSQIPTSIKDLVWTAYDQAGDEQLLWYYESPLTARLWLKILGRSALKRLDLWGEFAVSECVSLFDNKSSQVRLGAAKYLARITQNIDPEAAAEVFETIIISLEQEQVQLASADYWNGALISIAEIVRRAGAFYISENLIIRLVNSVLDIKGLHFVQHRIKNNIGTNVRDAACYACWSLFRSRLVIPQPQRKILYSSLISLACLDNEINVRRAAAAALHEGLGRHGSSAGDMSAEEMFKLIGEIHFNSVTSLSSCYAHIAPKYSYLSHFCELFVIHGVNSRSSEIRRLAASSSLKILHHKHLVDLLLDGEDVDEHGKLLVLGSLYNESNPRLEYRIEDVKKLVNVECSSELEMEGMLSLAGIFPEKLNELLLCVAESENPHVINAAEKLIQRLQKSLVKNSIIPIIEHNMARSRLLVACLVQLHKKLPAAHRQSLPLILRASKLPDPQSRAISVACLEASDKDCVSQLLAAMCDYTQDKRGDVGAWVREAAIYRLIETGLPDDRTVEIKKRLWLMSSDSRQKTRKISGKALFILKLISTELDLECSSNYYLSLLQQCPLDMRKVVAQGIASSVGAAQASAATINGSLIGLLEYLTIQIDSIWILEEILKLDRSSNSSCLEVIRTLRRVVTSGFELNEGLAKRALAIAFNTTLTSRLPEQIMFDAIDVLQVMALKGFTQARNRIISLLRNFNGRVRQRSADALFEIGVDDPLLETADLTTPKEYAQVWKIMNEKYVCL